MEQPIRTLTVTFAFWAIFSISGCGLLVPEHHFSYIAPKASEPHAKQQARLEHFQHDLQEHWEAATDMLAVVKEPSAVVPKGLLWVVALSQRVGANAACPLSAWHRLAVEAGVSSVVLLDRAPDQMPQVELTLETDSESTPSPGEQQ